MHILCAHMICESIDEWISAMTGMTGKKRFSSTGTDVLNRDTGYVHSMDEVQWIPGAREAAARLCRGGWLLFVVTNQSGVARGFIQSMM